MNFKNFKKVHEDDDKAVLKNEMGHSITIAKKSLSKEHAKGLKDLPLYKADGDEVTSPDVPASDELPPQVGTQVPETGDAPETPVAEPQQRELASAEARQPQQPPVSQAPQAPAQAPDQTMVQDAQQQTQGSPPVNATAEQAAQYQQEATAYAQDIASGHITPQTYHSLFANKDTLGKIGTLFGLLIGGPHAQSAIMNMMDKQIANDLEAQKTSKTNAQNFIRLNQQNQLQKAQIPNLVATGKLTGAQTQQALAAAKIDADTHAMMQMKISALNYAMQLAGKYPPGSPQAAAAQQTLQGLSQGVQQSIQQTSQTAAQQKAALEQQFGARQQFNIMAGMPDVAADNYAKHVPGFEGQASIPVSQGDREKIGTGLQFQQQLQRFMEWTKNHSGSLSPSQMNEGRAMAADLQGAYRQATHGGVYKEGEQNFISKLIDQEPTKFFNSIRVSPQLEALSRENTARIDQTAKNIGLPGYKNPAEEQKSNPREGATGTHAGKPVIFKNGKWSYR